MGYANGIHVLLFSERLGVILYEVNRMLRYFWFVKSAV